MAYVDKGGQADRKTAIIGVAAIHAGIGTVLVFGLSTQIQEIFVPPPPIDTFDVKTPPPPDPTPKVEETKPQMKSTVFVPETISPLSPNDPPFETTPVLPPLGGEIVREILPPADPGRGIAPTPPPPAFDPISATPRNNVSKWVTTDDYRDSWINREMTGTVRFKVSVGTNGKVQNCQIVSSTGHTALDTATCRLVKRRAKFNPAKDSNGDIVTGSFTRSVKWQLPD